MKEYNDGQLYKEKPPEFYTGDGYLKDGVFEKYMTLYNAVVNMLPIVDKNPKIVDMGCGVGYFAKVLYKHGYRNYTGVDFSSQIINKAEKLNLPYKFTIADIRNEKIFEYYDANHVFTCLEVLEHVGDDIKVLNNLPKTALFIFSVPSFNSKSHVRYFLTMDEVINRYEHKLIFMESKIVGKKFLTFKCRVRRND